MSSILQDLMGQLGGSVLGQMNRQVEAPQDQLSQLAKSAIPALLAGLSRNASNEQGAQALLGALDRDHDGSILDDLSGFLGSGQSVNDGQKILGHIFGSRQNQVARHLGQESGLSQESVSKVMAMLAPVVLGALGRNRRQEQSMSASDLGRILGRERRHIEREQPKSLGALGGILDSDGDGDVDSADIARKGAGLLGRLFGRR